MLSPPTRTALALGACCVGLALWHPGDDGVPLCPTKAVLGFDCPLCGGLRAVAELTRGRPLLAADHNVFVAVLAPIAILWWLGWWWRDRRGETAPRVHIPTVGWAAIVTVALAFSVIRNLPVAGVPHWLAAGTA